MVIPMGGLGEGLAGPFPPEMAHRARMIKLCIFGLIASISLKLFAVILDGRLSEISGSLNLLFGIITGIFLLNDDVHLKSAYDFMMNTCCQPCQGQCQGGLNCLMAWTILNVFYLIWDLLFNSAANMAIFGTFSFLSMIKCTAIVISYVAQGVGAFQGWKSYGEARNIGTMSVPGQWSESGTGRPSGGGGGGWGSAWGGSGSADEGHEMGEPSAGFKVFSGSGNRLGGE
mmetsp:Transcript_86870/g.246346  ORF Transcript_86870/g.246346 Transcript_86870/m.246346 type:complete len:229 (-) Transcript_86870:93-779(-)